MKFTIAWLLEHLDTELSPEEIVEALTSLGFEVENYKSIGDGFVVAHVDECHKHPHADRLSVCNVSDGTRTVQVVCGAPNVRAGIKVVLAQVGAIIPSTMLKIRKSKIRGCESVGMICSSSELSLSEEDDGGILELPDSYKVGDVFTVDPLIEIAVTPNRGDALSVHGVARELAAGGYGVLIEPSCEDLDSIASQGACGGKKHPPVEGSSNPGDSAVSANHFNCTNNETVSNQTVSREGSSTAGGDIKREGEIIFTVSEADICRRFSGVLVEDVTNCVSPDWLKSRLKRIGVKAVSALVDIANYVMFSYGLPMHVYDADKIDGQILHVSISKEECNFFALDGNEYQVPAGSIVIRDRASDLQAVAGIIGSKKSCCTPSTRNIFIEAAAFDPVKVALTKRAMKINTEAAYRFERGVDANSAEMVLKLACRMILDICGGKAKDITTLSNESQKESIKFSASFFSRLTGIELDPAKMVRILQALGFTVYIAESNQKSPFEVRYSDAVANTTSDHMAVRCSADGADSHLVPVDECQKDLENLVVIPPSWRNDISTQACLVEEILRVHGYNQLCSAPLLRKSHVVLKSSSEDKVREFFKHKGFSEVLTWSFMSEKKCEKITDLLSIKNPLGSEFGVMRPSIIPNLVDVAQKNLNNGTQIIRIFEIGKVYSLDWERKTVAGLLCGDSSPRNLHEKAHKMDFFDLKAYLEGLFTFFNLGGRYSFKKGELPPFYHPGKAAVVRVNDQDIGFMGELHPKIVSEKKIVAFELCLDKLTYRPQKKEVYFGRYQLVERDFSFVFDLDKVPFWGDIERDLYSVSRLVRKVALFDKYEGDFNSTKMLSLAFLVSMENPEKGLSPEEIEEVSTGVIRLMEGKFSGVLRLTCR